MDPEFYVPQPIDPERYDEGYRAHMRGESFHLLDSVDASWRAGWNDAKKDRAENQDAPFERSPQSPLNLKGN